MTWDTAGFCAFVEAERQRFETPGLSVAVLAGGEVALERGFGHRDVDAALAATEHTLYAIGSTTKAFTATLLAVLVDEGLVDWDAPVRDYIPELRLADPFAEARLTLRDMLSHRSGMPRHDLVWYGDTTMTRRDVVARLAHLPFSRGLREVWQYNNLMYITAGHAAERVLGCTWEDAVRDRLLDPLGMERAVYSVDLAQQDADHATPYLDGAAVPWRLNDLPGPAGSITTSVHELVAWLELNLGRGERGGRRLVSESALAEVHAPTMVVPAGATPWPELRVTAYALGWLEMTYRGHRVMRHNGAIDGFTSEVLFVPGRDIGVAILANDHASPLPSVIAQQALDELLGLDPLPWGERVHEMHATIKQAAEQMKVHEATSAKAAPPSHPLADYAGRYNHPGYGDITIEFDGDALVPRYNNLDLSLPHRHYDVFTFCYEPLQQRLPLVFTTGTDGEVAGFTLQIEPTVAPLTFDRQPDAGLSDPARLAAFTGAYTIGPITLLVSQRDDGALTVGAEGGKAGPLLPRRDRVFDVDGTAGATAEFEVDGDRVVRLILTPGGIFEKVYRPT